ncbi:hypothetical protein HK099_001118 [Clydaea vesicula]|uniref:PROP1-like PPR domain-containing protein n=1 Tax=Clydaea vesicula TaxID=447962 RepID=A0AAD5XZ19_9FUNG|nr:hypothetical protein HK099_001118 [Clydaea vesicula]
MNKFNRFSYNNSKNESDQKNLASKNTDSENVTKSDSTKIDTDRVTQLNKNSKDIFEKEDISKIFSSSRNVFKAKRNPKDFGYESKLKKKISYQTESQYKQDEVNFQKDYDGLKKLRRKELNEKKKIEKKLISLLSKSERKRIKREKATRPYPILSLNDQTIMDMLLTKNVCFIANMFQYYKKIIDNGGSFTDTTTSAVLRFIAKRQRPKDLIAIFELLKAPSQFHYLVLFQYFVKVNDTENFEEYYGRFKNSGIPPTQYFFKEMIGTISCHKNFTLLKTIFADMKKQEIEPNAEIYNAILYMCSQTKNDHKIFNYYKEMKTRGFFPSLQGYSNLMLASLKLREFSLLDILFEEMAANCVNPDVTFFKTLIKTAIKMNLTQQIETFYIQMNSKGLPLDFVAYTTLMNAYIKLKQPDKVSGYFNDMISSGITPNTITYNTLINAYIQAEQLDKVDFYFQEMKKKDIKPDIQTYSSLINAYSKTDFDKAKCYLKEMTEVGMPPSMLTYHSLYFSDNHLNIPTLLNRLEEFSKLDIEPTFIIWGSIMNCFSNSGDYVTAFKIFQSLTGTLSESEVPPSLPIPVKNADFKPKYSFDINNFFLTAVTICKENNLKKELEIVWKVISSNDNIPITLKLLSSYFQALCHFEKFKDILKILKNSVKDNEMFTTSNLPKPNKQFFTDLVTLLDENNASFFVPDVLKLEKICLDDEV